MVVSPDRSIEGLVSKITHVECMDGGGEELYASPTIYNGFFGERYQLGNESYRIIYTDEIFLFYCCDIHAVILRNTNPFPHR